MSAITVNSITKTYGKEKKPAVSNVSFEVNQGELFGLIGPDGAGKTTLFRIMTSLLLPDSGTVIVEHLDTVKDYKLLRKTIGYMPGKFSLYPDLTIEENLDFFATLFNTSVKENYHLIRDIYIQLERFKDRRAGQLSGGMKQKLALCCALIHKPAVLFLDEPTTGVDPVSRKEFWEMLKRLKTQNITIVVSTPYMDEATMCDRIGLIHSGSILMIDAPGNIVQTYPDILYAIKSDSMYSLLAHTGQHPKVSGSYAFGEYAHVSFIDPQITPEEITRYLKEAGETNISVKQIKAGIEDSFILLLKKEPLHNSR